MLAHIEDDQRLPVLFHPLSDRRAFDNFWNIADAGDASGAPLAVDIRQLLLGEDYSHAAVQPEHLTDALDDYLDAALRFCGLLQSEHQAVDDSLALGLRLN